MMMDYIVNIGGNIDSLEKVIKKAQGQVKRISDDEVLIKLDYDGNLAAFNKTFKQVLKDAPELTVQFQYDVNKKILNQEMEKLQQLTTLKMDIESGNVNAKLKSMLKSLQDSYDNLDSESVLHSKMAEILKYANTLDKLNIDFDRTALTILEEFAEDYKTLDALLQKNETDPVVLFKIDKSLDQTIENTTKNVESLNEVIETLKKNGASDLSDNDEFKQLSDKVKVLASDIEDMKQQLGSLSGEAFEEMSRSVDTLEEKLSNALTRMQELREAVVNPKNVSYHIGNFEENPNRWKSESYNHIISNMNLGGFDEGDVGYGILGTGVYHTPNARDLQMGGDNPKGYAIDISKYKLFVASIDEEAERLMEFLGQMQGFVVAQGSSYRGWDEVLKRKNVNSETLYSQFKNIFGDTVMSVQDFESFLDEMIAQMNEISAGGLQVGAKAGDFKNLPSKYDHFDTAITQLMKRLGYEGIDFRGTSYDNYDQGNTIFELHPEDIIKTFSSQEELESFWKNNNEAIERFNSTSAQALGEAGENIQKLTSYVETLNERLNTLSNTVNALGDLGKVVDAGEALTSAAVEGMKEGQHSHSPSLDGEEQSNNLVDAYVDTTNDRADEAFKAGENLSSSSVEGLKEGLKDSADIADDLSLDFSTATKGQEKYELALVNTNDELQRMAELAFRADTANPIDAFANQTQMLKAQAMEEERIANEEAQRAAQIAKQNEEIARQQELIRGAAEAAFKMDTGQTGANKLNQMLAENYKETQRQVDETVRATKAQMEQAEVMSKQEDLAKNFGDAIRDYADEISRAEGNAEELATSLKKAMDITRNADFAGSSVDLLGNLQEEVRSNTESAKKDIESLLKTLDRLNDPNKYVQTFITQINGLSDQLNRLAQQKFINPAEVKEFQAAVKAFQDASKLDVNKNFKELSRSKYLNQISQYLSKYTGLSKKTRTEIEKIAEAMKKANNAGDLKELYDQFLKLQVGARDAGEEVQSMFTKVGNRLSDMNAKFFAQFFSFQDIIRYVRQLSENVIAVDSALTELRKVSDASTSRLEQSFEKSSDTALSLGQSIEHVINVTADWARLGYDVDAAEELARVTTLFTTVGDNMTSDDASSYLISTLQGYQLAADEAQDIVDKYNIVANNFAIDTRGIGEALQRSAASFNAANTDLSKSIALITATNEVVQNPESVGTLWKTMSARIRGAKTELEDLGEEQDAYTETTSKLRDLVKSLTGFDIMKNENEFKDIYEIILGIGKEWDKLSDIEQASLGEALAGKRNANALFAVLGNLETLEDAYKAAEKAAGSAEREQENYAKSIQYSLDRWQASVEKISIDLLNSDFLKSLVESGVSLLDVLDQIISKTNGLASIIAGLGAGIGFSKIGGVDAITSSLREAQDNYAVLNSSIEKYNVVAAKASAAGKDNIAQFIKADNVMGNYLKSLNGAQGSMKGYIGYLISAKAKTIALNVATAALNTAISMGVSIAVTALVSGISKLVTAEKEAREAAVDLAEAYEQESQSLNEQIEQYQKLSSELSEAKKNGEDTYSIKEQLLKLQDELNAKYGDEYEKLNLVNGAYSDQIAILKNLSKEKANDYLSTNEDQFSDAFDYLDKVRTYNLGELIVNGDVKGIIPILEKYGINTDDEGEGYVQLQLHATIEDADKAMSDLYAELKQYEKTHDVDLSFITEAISSQKQGIDKDEKYAQYKELRESYVNATIAADEELSEQYEKGIAAVEEYNKALESKEGIEAAKKNLDAVKSEIEGTTFDTNGIRDRFLGIFDGVDQELEKRNEIDKAFESKENDFMEYAEKLRGLTDLDLSNLSDSKQKGAFNYLLHSLGLTSDRAGLLIDKLVELGIVQSEVANNNDQLADSSVQWASELNAALEKLGLVKETSNGLEYDKTWTNYLETIKALNPEIADNATEVEKCALANMQFSKAVEDLSKNFKTYKQALKDADTLTPEFSDAITALADDLTYLTGINFSIEDASGFLADADNLSLLEKAISGSDEALQQLQARAAEGVKITVDVSELEKLEEYNEVRLALKLDSEGFNEQLQTFADWLNANSDMGEIDVTAMLDENPFIKKLVTIMSESSEVANAVKKLFAQLGWDITWDTTKMKVPKANGSHITSTYAKDAYGNALGQSYVRWDYEDMDVPTNIRFVGNNGSSSGSRKTGTSGYTPKSMSPSQKASAASNTSKANGGGGSDKDDFKEFYDYFERMIKVLDKQIDLLDAHLEDVVGSFAKNTLINAEEDLMKSKMNGYASAIDMYSQKASEALSKIPSDIAAKLLNGAVAIDEFVGEGNEEVYKAIQEYEQWADKVSDCKLELVKLKEAIRQLELQKFNNIMKDFTDQFDIRQSAGIDLISKQVDLLREAGELIGESFYKHQIDQAEKQLDILTREQAALVNQLNEALSNGIDKGSDEWLEMINSLTDVEGKILDCKKAIEEFDNALLELHTEVFNRIQDQFSAFNNELSNMIGLFDDAIVATKDNQWTKEGLTQLGMMSQQYELASYQVEQYNQEIERLNQLYLQGRYSTTEYADKLIELKEKQWDAVNASEAAKDSIMELNRARVEIVVEGINEEIDAYNELIDAQKRALDAERDLHEYRKQIAEESKAITDIQRQLAAIADDDSQAAAAKRARLEEQLKEAQDALAETEYGHSIDTQQDALDKQFEDYKALREAEIEELQNSLLDVEAILSESFDKVRENSELIGATILTTAQDHGIQMSAALTDAWFQGENAIARYGEVLNGETSNFIENMQGIEFKIWELQEQANQTSEGLASMFATRADNLVNELVNSYNSEANLDALTNALHDSLLNTIDGAYSGAGAAAALDSIADAANGVASAADNAANALQRMIEMQNSVPTESGPIYEIEGDEVVYRGHGKVTGSDIWKSSSGNVYGGHATGVKRVSHDELAWTQEKGPEMIISPGSGAILTPLQKGDSVLPADQTSNIWEWSKFDPSEFANRLIQSMPSTGKVQNNTMEVGALVQINGNVNDTAEMVQIAATQAATKIKQSFYQLSNGLNKG